VEATNIVKKFVLLLVKLVLWKKKQIKKMNIKRKKIFRKYEKIYEQKFEKSRVKKGGKSEKIGGKTGCACVHPRVQHY
jgi:hypothetical protein